LYEPLLAVQPREGVMLHADVRYGDHERHCLDVYEPESKASSHEDALSPVLVCVHGGGFIRGDKTKTANAGWCFARAGVLTVVPNYRLAPESRWPCGPEDVAAVVQWVRAHARRYGGDPERIVLLGESAGAAHVAAATLWRRFGLGPHTGVRGAVLLSGPYDARLERLSRAAFGTPSPDPRNDAYFGTDDAEALNAMSTVTHIDAAPFPLLISFAERDLLQMQAQAGQLFATLARDHGFTPALACLPDHNHFSQTLSINTADTRVSGRILDFVQRHA
jgi:acetyl esterase/lipase